MSADASKEGGPPGAAGSPVLAGMRRCLGVPAVGLFLSMVGFGALASDLGYSGLQALATTAFVWGLPGQIAYVDLAAAGAPVGVLVGAVAFANMRMLPMTVSGLPAILGGRRTGFLGRIALMQFMAVTAWTQMIADAPRVRPADRTGYYVGFVAVLYLAGLVGTAVGHSAGAFLPDPAMRVAVFMTPLYLLLLVSAARRPTNKHAVALGGVLGVALYPLIADAAVLAAGLIGGSIAFAAGRLRGAEEG